MPRAAASAAFLPELADVRSVYAPDLPGFGESDSSPTRSIAEAAGAISDLANDLRLRQIDLLGVHFGAEVALELAADAPGTREAPGAGRRPGRGTLWRPVKQPRSGGRLSPPTGTIRSAPASQTLAKQIGAFLRGHA